MSELFDTADVFPAPRSRGFRAMRRIAGERLVLAALLGMESENRMSGTGFFNHMFPSWASLRAGAGCIFIDHQ